jgi:hypothetical protein
MKAKTEELLYLLLWSTDQLMRPTFRNLTDSFETWAYRNGLFQELARLERRHLLERLGVFTLWAGATLRFSGRALGMGCGGWSCLMCREDRTRVAGGYGVTCMAVVSAVCNTAFGSPLTRLRRNEAYCRAQKSTSSRSSYWKLGLAAEKATRRSWLLPGTLMT